MKESTSDQSLYLLLIDFAVGGTACSVIIVAILLKKSKHIPTVDSQEENGYSNTESLPTQRDAAHEIDESETHEPLTFQNKAYMHLHHADNPVLSGGEARLGVCGVSMETGDAISDEIRGAVPGKEQQDTDSEGYEIVEPSSLTTPINQH